jgi:hypothetical protein
VRQGYRTLNKHDPAGTFEILEGLELEVLWSGFKEWRLQNHETERKLICSNTNWREGPMVALWLRHCATNRKDVGSIPDGVAGFFY